MRLVQQANQRPFHCAVIPFKGNSNSAGFIDTGQFIGDDKVFVSFEGAALLAKTVGWHPPSVVRTLQADNAAKAARIDQLEAELLESNRSLDAIEYIGRGPMKAYKKAGRPKKEAANAV